MPGGLAFERRIPRPPPIQDPSPVTFSLKYLDLESNNKFGFELCTHEFLRALLLELKRLCAGTVSQFCEWDNTRQSHAFVFNETTEPEGFLRLDEQLEPEFYWQFGIERSRPWRVHGFFIDSVFYIVWLDPEHRLNAQTRA